MKIMLKIKQKNSKKHVPSVSHDANFGHAQNKKKPRHGTLVVSCLEQLQLLKIGVIGHYHTKARCPSDTT